MKNNTKRYIKLSVILYIVILSVALIGTLAWFVFKQDAVISTDEDSKIVAGEYLEICLDGEGEDEWVSEIALKNPAQYPDVSVTPDGIVWYPTTLDENDELIKDEKVFQSVNGSPEGYFVKLDLKVRASKGMDVYLHKDSQVAGMDMDKTDAANAFSKDAIAGAARVAFFEKDQTGALALKTVWIPNENYELTFEEKTVVKETAEGEEGESTEETQSVPKFSTNGKADTSYNYIDIVEGNVLEKEWDPNQLSIGNDALASGSFEDGMFINSATSLLTFSEAGEKNLTVYIWIEGTDDEAHTVLSGGSISYKLRLVGIEKKSESTFNIDDVDYDKTEDKLIYKSNGNTVGSEIQYSYDKKEWNTYAVGKPDFVNDDTTVIYVRAKETDTEKVGSIKEIQVK